MTRKAYQGEENTLITSAEAANVDALIQRMRTGTIDLDELVEPAPTRSFRDEAQLELTELNKLTRVPHLKKVRAAIDRMAPFSQHMNVTEFVDLMIAVAGC